MLSPISLFSSNFFVFFLIFFHTSLLRLFLRVIIFVFFCLFLTMKLSPFFHYLLRFYHTLISFFFIFIFRFSFFISVFTSSLSCILHPFPPLFPSVLLLFYANFSLSAIAISPWGVFAFILTKAFVRELKCPAITRLAGSITCRVTQFLRGSLLLLSLTIRGMANELVPHRFYEILSCASTIHRIQ